LAEKIIEIDIEIFQHQLIEIDMKFFNRTITKKHSQSPGFTNQASVSSNYLLVTEFYKNGILQHSNKHPLSLLVKNSEIYC